MIPTFVPVVGSLAIALLLSIMALPAPLGFLNPLWVLLVLVYWGTAFPRHVGVLAGFLSGLALDILREQTLGTQAIPLAITMLIVLMLYPRMRVFPAWQQALIVLLLALLARGTELWILGAVGQRVDPLLFALPVITTALIWPVVFRILRTLRRRFLLHVVD